jgi:hypothetical protein
VKAPDKFLVAILAGVVLLVGITFAAALLRPAPTYRSDETPEGVAHNYLLALEQEEFDRAYSYLSPTLEGYPDSADEFADDVRDYSWQFQSVALAVESTRVTGDEARVTVRETFSSDGGLFSGGNYSTTFDMRLQEENGEWKLIASDSYWLYCWTTDDADAGC